MIPVHQVLPDMLGEIVRRQPLSPAKVDFAWRTAVGTAVARVSTARLDRDGTLRVTVEDDRWRREINRSRSLIQARLERLLGPDLQRIEIHLGPLTTSPHD
jgi:predicted nucleic acid-binding Zn ribbon protein